MTSEQVSEWSRRLFKCIKPVGEPEFRLNGDIGTGAVAVGKIGMWVEIMDTLKNDR